MPYWIYEKGEPIGPLRFEDVVKRAKPVSLVSHNREWLPFSEHPDFSNTDRQLPPGGAPHVGGVKSKADGKSRPHTKGRVLKVAILGCLVIVIGVVALFVVIGKVAERAVDEEYEVSAEQGLPDESSETPWAYSEPIDTVKLESISRVIDVSEVESWLRPVMESAVQRREIARLENGVAWVPSSAWQAEKRSYQKEILLNLAIIGCNCLDPGRWDAEVRSVESDELFASISPNGLRALWTRAGVFPASAGNSGSVDLTSGMTSDERLQALWHQLEFVEGARLGNAWGIPIGEAPWDIRIRLDQERERLLSEIRAASASGPPSQPETAGGSDRSPSRVDARKTLADDNRAAPSPSRPAEVRAESQRPRTPTQSQGHIYFPGGTSATEQIPSWVPVYSNGRFQNPSFMGMGNALIGGFEVVTSDPVDAVVAFYRASLKNAGFAIEGDSPSSGDGGTRRINAQNSAADRKVEITLRRGDGETIVTVSYSQGR